MAQQTTTVEMWACVNSEGEYAVAADEAAAREQYENDIGALNEAGGFRLVKVCVTVPLPEIIELEIDAPAESGEATAAVA